jgi:hypothetical protein
LSKEKGDELTFGHFCRMIFAYIRVSTDKQTNENQRFELTRFAEQRQ